MRALLLLAASTVAFAAPKWHQLAGYTFDQYIKDFGKSYSDAEYLRRRVIFNTRLAKHIEHNAKGLSWKNGVNKFTDWTDAERKAMMGYDFARAAQRRHHNLGNAAPFDFARLNRNNKTSSLIQDMNAFSWVSMGYVNSVPDQGTCGSCWAFGSKVVLESRVSLSIPTRNVPTLSPQQLISCAPNTGSCGGTGGCGGSTAELAYNYLAQNNVLQGEFVLPYSSYSGNATFDTPCDLGDANGVTVTGYVNVPSNSQAAVMKALTTGPLAVAVFASPWTDYETGVFNGCDSYASNMDLNHVVALTGVGSDENGAWWEIRNSWGAGWGEGGVIRLFRNTNTQPSCFPDVAPQDGTGCLNPPGPKKVTVCGECGVLYDAVFPTGPSYVQA